MATWPEATLLLPATAGRAVRGLLGPSGPLPLTAPPAPASQPDAPSSTTALPPPSASPATLPGTPTPGASELVEAAVGGGAGDAALDTLAVLPGGGEDAGGAPPAPGPLVASAAGASGQAAPPLLLAPAPAAPLPTLPAPLPVDAESARVGDVRAAPGNPAQTWRGDVTSREFPVPASRQLLAGYGTCFARTASQSWWTCATVAVGRAATVVGVVLPIAVQWRSPSSPRSSTATPAIWVAVLDVFAQRRRRAALWHPSQGRWTRGDDAWAGVTAIGGAPVPPGDRARLLEEERVRAWRSGANMGPGLLPFQGQLAGWPIAMALGGPPPQPAPAPPGPTPFPALPPPPGPAPSLPLLLPAPPLPPPGYPSPPAPPTPPATGHPTKRSHRRTRPVPTSPEPPTPGTAAPAPPSQTPAPPTTEPSPKRPRRSTSHYGPPPPAPPPSTPHPSGPPAPEPSATSSTSSANLEALVAAELGPLTAMAKTLQASASKVLSGETSLAKDVKALAALTKRQDELLQRLDARQGEHMVWGDSFSQCSHGRVLNIRP